MGLAELVGLSRSYGADPEWVLAGGGNTSFKDENHLWIKASGTTLVTIEESGFVAMDRSRLQRIWSTTYPTEPAEREKAALTDLMDSRVDPGGRRPSVETLLHELFPFAYVVHTHPALINGMTCGAQGDAISRDLFGDSAVWIGQVEPGYVLAHTAREMLTEHRKKHGREAQIVFLANHGVVVAADHPEEVHELQKRVADLCRSQIESRIGRYPNMGEPSADPERQRRAETLLSEFRRRFPGRAVSYRCSEELLGYLRSEEHARPLLGTYTPDHVVYCGSMPQYVAPVRDGEFAVDVLLPALTRVENPSGSPQIILCENTGVFALAGTPRAMETAQALFADQVKIAFYSEAFGGHRFMEKRLVDFILSWEVERYRAVTSLKAE
jgi:rhamnose utilization protein RhaD (predicted bifunctional aldolase and dehydrogenase)